MKEIFFRRFQEAGGSIEKLDEVLKVNSERDSYHLHEETDLLEEPQV